MKVGFLPLYIKLYDEVVPEIRPRLEKFYDTIAGMIEKEGLEVIKAPFCRVKNEFEEAVEAFELKGAEAIITLHMAYSPSLESIDVLCKTDLPIVVLDTTETEVFGNMQDPGEIMFNHGIHGVMDLCSMFKRRGKEYAIAAGHYSTTNVVSRACGFVKASIAANALKNARVGIIGGAFEGMGDFRVSYEELAEKFGIRVETMDANRMRKIYDGLTDEEVAAEKKENADSFIMGDNIIDEEYDLSVRSCLALRKYVKECNLTAFTVNFTQVGREASGLTSMPFLEACKAMANGTGYAGEGDALTAAFTGAFIKVYPNSSFVEIFCPDWKNQMVFLSHMGEMNYALAAEKPEIRRADTNYSPAAYPYAGYTRLKGAKGVYVNISRAKDNYCLVASEAELIDFDKDDFQGSMRGWMRPVGQSTASFLEGLSRNGATHHSVFVTGATTEEMAYFGKLLNMDVEII